MEGLRIITHNAKHVFSKFLALCIKTDLVKEGVQHIKETY